MTDAEKNKAKLIGDLRDADKAAKNAQEKADNFRNLCDTIATKLATDHKQKGVKINGRPVNITIKNGAERRAAKAAGQDVPAAMFTLSEPREIVYDDGDAIADGAVE